MPRNRFILLLLAGLTLLLALFVLSDWLPALRGPAVETSEWHWRYGLRPVARWWPAVVAAVGLGLWGWWGVTRGELRGTRPRKAEGRNSGELKRGRQFGSWDLGFGIFNGWLVGLVVGSLAVQLALVYAHRPAVAAELVDRTLSNESNGYFTAAVETADMGDLLRHFPERMPTLPSEHTRTHPPGLIVGQWLTIRAMAAVPAVAEPIADWVRPLRCIDVWYLDQEPAVLAALAVWAFLPLVAGALSVVPVYGLGRRLYGERAGRLAAVLAAGLPSLLIFAPTPDQLFAFLSAGTVLAWLVAMERESGLYSFLAGTLLSLATFLSLGNGALALVIVLLLIANPESKIQNLKSLLLFAAGVSLFWLLYWIGWGVAPWEVARVGLDQHYELVTSQRRYSWWVGYNLIDLLLFAGPLVVGGFLLRAIQAGRRFVGGQSRTADHLALALGLLLLALDVSGTARGEVGRLWLFLMPLLAVVAAGYVGGNTLSPDPSPSEGEGNVGRVAPGGGVAALLIGAQLILALSLGLAWRPIEAVMVVAERPVMAVRQPEQQVDFLFGDEIRLVGYDIPEEEGTAGGTLAFTLFWQREGQVERPYTVFTHLVDETGTLVAQQDNWPVQGQWPPTCWQERETVVDEYQMVLPQGLRPGQYTLLVGLYDARDGGRLVTAGAEDQVRLVEIEIGN
jgi:4-amino-4-deoxy-L-arabinose transferase-like glycosyltransferase